MKIKISNIRKTLYLFLGIFIGNDVFYFFHTGSTYLNFTILISLLLVCVNFIYDQKLFKRTIHIIDKYVKYFFLLILISSFMSLLFFGVQGLRSWLMGFMDLFFAFSVYVNAMMSDRFKNSLYKGILTGFLLNVGFSFFQFVLYRTGNHFTLATMFPNPAFQQNIYWYRSQGLFLETSHYLSYLSCVFPLLILYTKDKTVKSIFTIISVLMSLYLLLAVGLAAGSTIIYILAIIITFLSSSLNKIGKFKRKSIGRFIFASVIIGVGICFFVSKADMQIVKKIFDQSLKTSSLSDKDNVIRSTSMLQCLHSGIRNPIGYGYNSSALFIKSNLNLSVSSPFNYLIQMLLELGYLGAIVYITIVMRFGLVNVVCGIKKKNNEQLLVGVASIFAFLCQFVMGRFLYPYICVVYGLANLYINESGAAINYGSKKG